MQTTLFGRLEAPSFDHRFESAERTWLDETSWVDRVPGWVLGQEAFFDRLREALRWRAQTRQMYEQVVAVPRLLANVPSDGEDPLLRHMADALSSRYELRFESIMLALYRDGRDSVAWHRDKVVRDADEGVVAIASLGGPRRFQLRRLGGGPATTMSTGWGDLIVMGGTSLRLWEHGVPKQRHAEPRMALMFRHSCDPRGSSRTSASRSHLG